MLTKNLPATFPLFLRISFSKARSSCMLFNPVPNRSDRFIGKFGATEPPLRACLLVALNSCHAKAPSDPVFFFVQKLFYSNSNIKKRIVVRSECKLEPSGAEYFFIRFYKANTPKTGLATISSTFVNA